MALTVIILVNLTSMPRQAATPSAHDTLSSAIPTQTKKQEITAMANAWSGDIAYGAPYPALTPLRNFAHTATDTHFDPTDDYWGLPRSDGYETVASYCGACHSLAIVMRQRQNETGWEYLLDWMTEKQGMAPPPKDIRNEIITYLAREFSSEQKLK